MDLGRGDSRRQVRAHEEVIQAPARITFPGFSDVAPPGVSAFLLRILISKSVDVTSSDDFVDPDPLFG